MEPAAFPKVTFILPGGVGFAQLVSRTATGVFAKEACKNLNPTLAPDPKVFSPGDFTLNAADSGRRMVEALAAVEKAGLRLDDTARGVKIATSSAFSKPSFAIHSRAGYAVEHVLAYSGALLQVPYNQHLPPRLVTRLRSQPMKA